MRVLEGVADLQGLVWQGSGDVALVRWISESCAADTVGGDVLAHLEGRRHYHGADISPWSQQLPNHASCSIMTPY